MKYIKENECGIVVGEKKQKILTNKLRSIIEIPRLRRKLGEKGRLVAQNSHNESLERERFRSTIKQALLDSSM